LSHALGLDFAFGGVGLQNLRIPHWKQQGNAMHPCRSGEPSVGRRIRPALCLKENRYLAHAHKLRDKFRKINS